MPCDAKRYCSNIFLYLIILVKDAKENKNNNMNACYKFYN